MSTKTQPQPLALRWADKHGIAIDHLWDGRWSYAILRNCTITGGGLAYGRGGDLDRALASLWMAIEDQEIRYVRDGAIYTYTVNPEEL